MLPPANPSAPFPKIAPEAQVSGFKNQASATSLQWSAINLPVTGREQPLTPEI
jgi:hypothetical protein